MNYLKELQNLGIKIKKHSGNIKTKCPKCSHLRKNKKDDCLSVNIDEGLYNCHHCGWQGNVLFKKKQEYVIPEKVKVNLTDRVVKWFADRKITEPTLEENKINERKVYMPQIEALSNSIAFPYYKNGELINVKYRDGKKNFRLEAGAQSGIYVIAEIEGVIDVQKVQFSIKNSVNYANSPVSIQQLLSADGTYLKTPKNAILEVKFPNLDIKGIAK